MPNQKYGRQKRSFIDGMRDAHFITAGKKVCIALEADHAVQQSRLLFGAGMEIPLAVIPTEASFQDVQFMLQGADNFLCVGFRDDGAVAEHPGVGDTAANVPRREPGVERHGFAEALDERIGFSFESSAPEFFAHVV